MPRGRVALGTPPSRGRGRARGEEAGEAAHPCGGPARAAWTPWTRGGRPWTRLSCTGTSLPRTKRDALSRGAFQPPSPGALPAPARGARGREATPPRSLGPGAGARPLVPPPPPPAAPPLPRLSEGWPEPLPPLEVSVLGCRLGTKSRPTETETGAPATGKPDYAARRSDRRPGPSRSRPPRRWPSPPSAHTPACASRYALVAPAFFPPPPAPHLHLEVEVVEVSAARD